MATAYHSLEIPVNMATAASTGGVGPVAHRNSITLHNHNNHHLHNGGLHHHHHHPHHQHQHHGLHNNHSHPQHPNSVELRDGIFAATVANDDSVQYYDSNATNASNAGHSAEYYSAQSAQQQQHHHHHHHHPHHEQQLHVYGGPPGGNPLMGPQTTIVDGGTAASEVYQGLNDANNHLMANEDGYWDGSPCSSDSTSESINRAPQSPYLHHQYAPVYYTAQYDRPNIIYADDGGGGNDSGVYNNYSTAAAGGHCDSNAPPSLLVTESPATAVDPNADNATLSTTTSLNNNGSQISGGGCPNDATSTTLLSIGSMGSHCAGAGVDNNGLPVPYVRVVKRRTTANKKERRRTQSINSAFTFLRDCIPNVPSDTKLSKIKTLRLATSYISYLTRVLEGDQDPSGGFRAELVPSSRKINAERRAKYEAQGLSLEDIGALCLSSSNAGSTDSAATPKKAKGRTGWPQHVWASELKQEP